MNDDAYSSSNERRRMLFLEMDSPPLDPFDAYFGRVLAYGPDPMLLDLDARIPDPAEPPLPISTELIRSVVPGQSNDLAGLNAMQKLIPSPTSPRHYLLPLPDGLNVDSPELFGFFVYELRAGHDGSRWSTAQGCFGRPLRVAGVQHPAPQLRCMVTRTADGVTVVAPYATPVLDGQNLRPSFPRTQLVALLYTQVLQADGKSWRNILLSRAAGIPLRAERLNHPPLNPALTPGIMQFDSDKDILFKLGILGLPLDSTLSVVAVELMPEPQATNANARVDQFNDPLGADLGKVRILRTSPLTPVPEICPPKQ
jgi:hypothetical protein